MRSRTLSVGLCRLCGLLACLALLLSVAPPAAAQDAGALPPAVQAAARPGERIVAIAPALSRQGSTYQVYYYATGAYRRADTRLFGAATPSFLRRQGITGFLVTRDGEPVRDAALLREVFLLYAAADALYNEPPAPADLGWEQDLAAVLENPPFPHEEPGAALQSRRDQFAAAMRLLLTDGRAANEADALLDEALGRAPKTLGGALDAVGGAAALAGNAAVGALADDLAAVYAGFDPGVRLRKNVAQGLRLAARLLWAEQLQQERAAWLAAYADAFVDGPGSFGRDELRAAFAVLAEAEDTAGRRMDVARGVVSDKALPAALKLAGENAAAALGALARRAGDAAGAPLSGHAAASALAAPAGLTIYDLLYGSDAAWDDFTLAARSAELHALFAAGRQAIEQRAQEEGDAAAFDGDLAAQWRAAYLLETLAAAAAQRSYAAGLAAAARLPGTRELPALLHEDDPAAAADDLAAGADVMEQGASDAFGAPPLFDAPVSLAGGRAAAPAAAAPAAPAAEEASAGTAAPDEAAAPTPAAPEPDAGMAALIEAAQAEGALTVIALPRNWCNYGEVIDAFEANYGIQVNDLNSGAGSGDELEAIRASAGGGAPEAPDVIDVGFAFGGQAVDEGLLQPYKVAAWDTIPIDVKHPDGYWYGDYFGVISFMVNKDVVADAPQDWDDLLAPEFGWAVGLAGDPRNSNHALLSVMGAGLARSGSLDDVTPGVEFFAELNAAGKLLIATSHNTLTAPGGAPLRIVWDYVALSGADEMAGSTPIEVVIPARGRVAGVYLQGISAYAPHPNAAKLWMEHLYSDAGQLMWMKGYCHPVREADLRARGVIPAELAARLPDVSGAQFPTQAQQDAARAAIAAQWESTVGETRQAQQ